MFFNDQLQKLLLQIIKNENTLVKTVTITKNSQLMASLEMNILYS